MSDVVERTLASIPKLLGGGSVPSSPKHVSTRGFHNFLRLVVRARTKSLQEEEQFIKHEIQDMQQKMSQPDVKLQQTSDSLCRAVYCSMLGYDVSCIYIYAVKLAQQGTGFEKRMGYLALSLLLNENHELILLIINTIQKDLNSSNLLDNCAALTIICQLINSELIPSLLPLVQEKLRHPRELVRRKAAMCLHSFVLKAPSLVEHIESHFQQILLDKDPGVMSVGVQIYSIIVKKNPEAFPSLTETLVGILRQVVHRRLPSAFEFHNIPMPWLQIDILKTLTVLGRDNERRSRLMYSVLQDVLQKTNMRERIGFAVLYECIITITSIHPHKKLVQQAATSVGRFIRSTNHSLKYIGIKSLTFLVKCYSEAALEHRDTIVELLEDEDVTIQRKTLDLLYNMANPTNVEVICGKMLEHLGRHSNNRYWQTDLVNKVTELADKYASSKMWYVDTIIRLLHTCKCQLPGDIVNKVIKVIEQGCGRNSNTKEEKEFRQYLVKKATECLIQEEVSSELVKMSAWIVGECAVMLKNLPEDKIISLVMKQFRKETLGVSTRLWLTSALTKLICAKVLKSDFVKQTIKESLQREKSMIMKQKLTELLRLLDTDVTLTLPTLSSGHNGLQIDFTLSFLDDFFIAALENGSQPYKSRNVRYYTVLPQDDKRMFAGLNLKAYSNTSSVASGPVTMATKSSAGASDGSGGQRESGLNLQGVKRVWGKQGLVADPANDDIERLTDLGPAKDLQAENHKNSVDAEKEKERAKKRELASALFGGIASPEQPKTGSFDRESDSPLLNTETNYWNPESGVTENNEMWTKPLPTADIGGWRNLHQSSVSNTDESKFSTRTDENSVELKNSSNEMPSLLQLSNEVTSLHNESQPTTSSTNQIQENSSRSFLANENNEPFLNTTISKEIFSLKDVKTCDENNSLLCDDNKHSQYENTLYDEDTCQINTSSKPGSKFWGPQREDGLLNLDERPCLPGRSNMGNFNQDLISPDSIAEVSVFDSKNQILKTQDNLDDEYTGTLYDNYVEDES